MPRTNTSPTVGPRRSASDHPSPLQWVGLMRWEALLFCAVLGLVLASALAVVHATYSNRVAFNELQELREQAAELDVAWGQLLIEHSTFGIGDRIEQRATEQLGMQLPRTEDIVVVRQPKPAEP